MDSPGWPHRCQSDVGSRRQCLTWIRARLGLCPSIRSQKDRDCLYSKWLCACRAYIKVLTWLSLTFLIASETRFCINLISDDNSLLLTLFVVLFLGHDCQCSCWFPFLAFLRLAVCLLGGGCCCFGRWQCRWRIWWERSGGIDWKKRLGRRTINWQSQWLPSSFALQLLWCLGLPAVLIRLKSSPSIDLSSFLSSLLQFVGFWPNQRLVIL